MISEKNIKTRAYDWGGNPPCRLLPSLSLFEMKNHNIRNYSPNN